MFAKAIEGKFQPALPGIQRKTLVFGAHTLMTAFELTKGSTLPRHSHPQEQTGFLVSGRIRLFIGEEVHEANGASWCIPGGIEHAAAILEDSIAIEIFSPVRQDYLPQNP